MFPPPTHPPAVFVAGAPSMGFLLLLLVVPRGCRCTCTIFVCVRVATDPLPSRAHYFSPCICWCWHSPHNNHITHAVPPVIVSTLPHLIQLPPWLAFCLLCTLFVQWLPFACPHFPSALCAPVHWQRERDSAPLWPLECCLLAWPPRLSVSDVDREPPLPRPYVLPRMWIIIDECTAALPPVFHCFLPTHHHTFYFLCRVCAPPALGAHSVLLPTASKHAQTQTTPHSRARSTFATNCYPPRTARTQPLAVHVLGGADHRRVERHRPPLPPPPIHYYFVTPTGAPSPVRCVSRIIPTPLVLSLFGLPTPPLHTESALVPLGPSPVWSLCACQPVSYCTYCWQPPQPPPPPSPVSNSLSTATVLLLSTLICHLLLCRRKVAHALHHCLG